MKSANLDKILHPKENPRRQEGSLLMHSLDTHSQQGGQSRLSTGEIPSFLNGQELVIQDMNLAVDDTSWQKLKKLM